MNVVWRFLEIFLHAGGSPVVLAVVVLVAGAVSILCVRRVRLSAGVRAVDSRSMAPSEWTPVVLTVIATVVCWPIVRSAVGYVVTVIRLADGRSVLVNIVFPLAVLMLPIIGALLGAVGARRRGRGPLTIWTRGAVGATIAGTMVWFGYLGLMLLVGLALKHSRIPW